MFLNRYPSKSRRREKLESFDHGWSSEVYLHPRIFACAIPVRLAKSCIFQFRDSKIRYLNFETIFSLDKERYFWIKYTSIWSSVIIPDPRPRGLPKTECINSVKRPQSWWFHRISNIVKRYLRFLQSMVFRIFWIRDIILILNFDLGFERFESSVWVLHQFPALKRMVF